MLFITLYKTIVRQQPQRLSATSAHSHPPKQGQLRAVLLSSEQLQSI